MWGLQAWSGPRPHPGAMGTGKAAGWRMTGLDLRFRGWEVHNASLAGEGPCECYSPPSTRSPGRPAPP